MDGLELTATLDATADFVDDVAQGGAHRNLNQTDVVDLTGQSEHLGALRLLGTDAGKPVGALGDDNRDIGESLHVVHVGGFHLITSHSRERGLEGGFAALAFHRVDQSGFLTADECAGAVAKLDVEIEARAEDVLAEQAVFAGLRDGDLQAVDG